MRSALCTVAFYTWGVMIGTLMVPMLIMPREVFRRFVVTWSAGNGFFLRVIAGVNVEIRNRQYRPVGPAIIASKHQSEWEAHVFLHELDDPAYVIKKELSYVPGYGWFCRKVNMIFVDRSGHARSLRRLVASARRAVGRGRPIVIFPEGTRVRPGGKLPYRPGVAALYNALDLPVIPVVHNSGMHWPKGSFRRYPGTIVMEYLPPIPAGLPRREFMDRLELEMEDASDRLMSEVGGPHSGKYIDGKPRNAPDA
jgi:1-acyl-sn-glycerol-3-phosphate acyltransferase